VLLLLVAVSPFALLLGLRSRAVRQHFLERAGDAVEQRTGVRATAGDFRLDPWAGTLGLDELVLSAGDAESPPFLVVGRVEISLSWSSLLGGERVRVHELHLENPRLDLSAPLPSPASDGAAGGSSPGVELARFEVSGGRLLGSTADRMDPLLDAWRLEDLALTGSFLRNRFEAELGGCRLVVESRRRAPIEANLVARLSGDLDGGFTIESLSLAGGGLVLDATARGSLDPLEVGELSFDLSAEPARLFPDLTSGGQVEGRGDLRLRRSVLSGELRLEAGEIPAELLGPWLGEMLAGRLDVDRTWLDVDADLQVEIPLERLAEDPGTFRGTAALRWRSAEEELLSATLRSEEAAGDHPEERVHLLFEAELLPGDPGRRRLEGQLLAPGWPTLDEASLRDVQLTLELPELAGAAERLGLLHADSRDVRPVGELHATARADGPLIAPDLRLDAEWTEHGWRLATLSARTTPPGGGSSPVRLSVEGVIFPDAPGRRELAGALLAPSWYGISGAELRDGRVELELPDLLSTVQELSRLAERILPALEIPSASLGGELFATAGISGKLVEPRLEVEATWRRRPDEAVRLTARGRLLGRWPFLIGEGELTADRLEVGEQLEIERLRAEVQSDGETLDLRSLSGVLGRTPLGEGPSPFEGCGEVLLEQPIRQAAVRLEFLRPVDEVRRLTVEGRLVAGTLRIELLEIDTSQGTTTVTATVPLGLLGQLSDGLGSLPIESADGPISLTVSDLKLETILALLKIEGALSRIGATFDGSVAVDPQELMQASGTVSITDLAVEVEGGPIETSKPLRVSFAGGRLTLVPTRLEPTGGPLRRPAPLDVAGFVELNPEWQPGDPPAALVSELSVEAKGRLDASMLTLWIKGAVASGELLLEAEARGSPDALEAELSLRGPGASLFWTHPFATKFADPQLDLTVREGKVTLNRLHTWFNGGTATATGTLDPERGAQLHAVFEDVRYRFVYDLAAVIGGELDLTWPRQGRRTLSGKLNVERGLIHRDVNFEREALRMFFGRRGSAGWNPVLNTIDLDVAVTTSEGVYVRNNAARLHADWSRIDVGGTLADPLLTGRLEIDPGGKLRTLGQVIRIDEGAFVWSGQPVDEARSVFEMTTSFDDPTLRQSWRDTDQSGLIIRGPGSGGVMDFWRKSTSTSSTGGFEGGGWEELVAANEGWMFSAGSVGLTKTELSYQPLPLFGETGTQARFTVTQQISPNITFIASTNPREAEDQIYIVDVHQLGRFSNIRGQLFTKGDVGLGILDPNRWGLTVQQTHRFGGHRQRDPSPRVRSVSLVAPDEVRDRKLRRAVGFRKGDPFPPGATMDVEVDVGDALHGRGYPTSRVHVTQDSAPGKGVDLHVSIDSGPRIGFVFEGTKLGNRERQQIVRAYRPAEIDEEVALAHVEQESRAALRGLGYPWPDVQVTAVEHESDDGPVRSVHVVAFGGRRIEPREPVLLGLPEEDARFVAARFDRRRSRVELALGDPNTDEYLLHVLALLGYREPSIVSRELSTDGETLTVKLAPGPREQISRIEVEGLDPPLRDELAEGRELTVGQPARRGRIRVEATRLEQSLRNMGYADARVVARVESTAEGDHAEVVVRFVVDTGPSYRVADVRFTGLKSSKTKWAGRIAGIEPGGPLRADEITTARRQLYGTGVFSQIRVVEERDVAGPQHDDAIGASVTFEVQERPRFAVSYGARWESDEGLGLVVDFLDHNSLGRGHTTGVRGIWGRASSLRLYHVIPRVLGPANTVELFVEGKQERVQDTDVRGVEAWGQLTVPLNRWLQTRGYLRFKHLDVKIENPDPELSLDDRAISPILGWQLVYSTIDRALSAQDRKGFFFGTDLSGASTRLGSDLTYAAVYGQVKLFLPFVRKYTWAQSWRVGLQDAKDEPIPFVDRQRAGGEYSVRGYPTDSLGPRSPEGVALGGELMFVVNQEVHRRLWETVSGLVFFDAGNVWADRRTVDSELFKAAGVGVRYGSPIGPLRLDLAWPLDRREDDPAYKFYVGFLEESDHGCVFAGRNPDPQPNW